MTEETKDKRGDKSEESPAESVNSDGNELGSKDEDDWDDIEPDQEDIKVIDFFSDEAYPNAKSMIENCKKQHGFDFTEVQKKLGLDFYSSIKLVNYIRQEVKSGNSKPDVSSKIFFEDEKYLIPVLDGDALLFSLGDLDDSEDDAIVQENDTKDESSPPGDAEPKAVIASLQHRLESLQAEFSDYKAGVRQSILSRLDNKDEAEEGNATSQQDNDPVAAQKRDDDDYYHSYSYKDIHELMLKDRVRTDAYRDFIYANKDLFKDKLVLDVGCGTGILSMFCARAGARRVFAVDNSAIIDKAREIVYTNKLDDKITCVRGRIEDVKLPEEQVDIIVSEWMGYCLLYEAMLDSVIWARDRYLKPDSGLMLPSHCTIHVAPLADPDYITDCVDFWHDVYGFDMSAMMGDIYDEVVLRHVSVENLAATSYQCKEFALHSTSTRNLDFASTFQFELTKDIDSLDGWVLWFDTFFLPSRSELPKGARAEAWNEGDQGIAFTTGPAGKQTHWQSGVLLIGRAGRKAVPLKRGERIEGVLRYSKGKESPRALDIVIEWQSGCKSETGCQIWHMK